MSIGLAHAALARMHLINSHREMALVEAEQAVQLSPHDSETVILAANIMGSLEERDQEVIGILERAAEQDPNNQLVYQIHSR